MQNSIDFYVDDSKLVSASAARSHLFIVRSQTNFAVWGRFCAQHSTTEDLQQTYSIICVTADKMGATSKCHHINEASSVYGPLFVAINSIFSIYKRERELNTDKVASLGAL